MSDMTQAALDVLAERRRQIEVEGWTPEHDDEHSLGEMAALAAFYAVPDGVREWDFSSTGYGDTLVEAQKAEIERLTAALRADCEACNQKLRAAVQHEADCVEAAKAEVEALRAERDALLDALQHMRHCGWCAADDWQNCEGGRAALAAIDAAKGRA